MLAIQVPKPNQKLDCLQHALSGGVGTHNIYNVNKALRGHCTVFQK